MKTTITNSVSFASFISSQVFAAWAVLAHIPESLPAIEKHRGLVVPENIQGYLNFENVVNNTPVLWYSAWILVLLAGGFVAWRFREVRWPTYLLVICASAEFLWFATMVTRTEHFLGTLAPERASLLNDGELEEMRTTFAAIASENAAKVCKRPPLRTSTILQGNADEHMLALLAKVGAMESCYTNLELLEASIEDEDGVLGLLLTPERRGRALNDNSELNPKQEAAIAALQETCGLLPEVMSRAVSHEDACSPYLPGRLGPGTLLPFIEISKAAVLVSRKLAQQGERLEAVQLLLDTLRFGQDLSRGGTSLLEPMLVYASHRIIRPEINLQFDALSLDELRLIDEELALLIASQPHYSEYFDGERNSVVLDMVWPSVEPPGWQPPGGYPYGQSRPPDLADLGGPTVEETAMLTWIVFRDNAKIRHEKCAKTVPLRTCLTVMDRQLDKWSEEAKPDVATLLKIATLSDAKARAELRETIAGVLRATTPDYGKYYLRIEIMRIALLAQHNKIRSLIAAKEGKPCPVVFIGDDKDLLPRAVTQDGEIRLHAPQWMVDRASTDAEKGKHSETLVHIRCS
jgi:hypothetical protein